MGHPISHSAVADLLPSLGYSLQGTRKTQEGKQHPDRDAQFRYLNNLAEQFLASGDPVISVDTKKKELVGRYAQAGAEWHPKDTPVQVSTYDFPDQAEGKAIPYGVYDLPITVHGSRWVSITTPQCSPWPPSNNGGTRWARTNTGIPADCSSPPTAAAPTATAPGSGIPTHPTRYRTRHGNHCLPLPTRHQQMEQD
jgi:hypothetical protein